MSFQIPDDDDDIEMEELEGLIHVNPFAENKERHLASQSNVTRSSSKYKGHSASFLGTYRNKTNGIKMFIFIGIILIFMFHGNNNDNNNDGSAAIIDDNNTAVDFKGSNSIVDKKSENSVIDESQKEKEDEIITNPETNDNIEEETTKEEEDEEDEKPIEEEQTNEENEEDINSIEKWGKWKFYDGGEEIRPKEDYCANYPNRDIPGSDFPDDSWQIDAVYVNHFLNDGISLVKRVEEAILTEYGHGKYDGMSPKELVLRRQMFELTMIDDDVDDRKQPDKPTNAGISTKSSYKGLVKRLLHAMITNDNFTVVLGGHSAAAGHGNHFKQSYMMQFYYIMEPVFKRLGVNLIVRNLAQGGLGTMQSSLGSKDIYGSEVDVLVWDSGMTEKKDSDYDLFARQAILGGNRVPFLYNGHFNSLFDLHDKAGVDVLKMGDGSLGIPTTMDEEQVLTLPWAVRYMDCDPQRQDLCDKSTKYRTQCWVDRDDVIPPTEQRENVGSQVSWHPGFRHHQLLGRLMSFVMLEALEDALSIWSEETIIGGHPLQEKFWHVTDHYNTIKENVQNLEGDYCEERQLDFPKRICNTALNGRTEFTPRTNPAETSILSLVRPAGDDDYLPQYSNTLLYDGPDVSNPALELPTDENVIDVHEIAGARRKRRNRKLIQAINNNNYNHRIVKSSHHKHTKEEDPDEVIPGLGWSLDPSIPPGNCDGTYDAICARTSTSDCLLSGHMDGRGGLFGDSLSGWLVMDLPNVNKGLIIVKLETEHTNENKRTEGWESENNNRNLKGKKGSDEENETKLCKYFKFHYSVNGNITTLRRKEFIEKSTHPERMVKLLTILDDENFGEHEKVEVAIRISGCKRTNSFKLTHVYWA